MVKTIGEGLPGTIKPKGRSQTKGAGETVMTSSTQNDLGKAPSSEISTRDLIVRGALLLVLGYFAAGWINYYYYEILWGSASGWGVSVFIRTLLPCIVYFLLGVIASYVFWPRKHRAAAVWLGLFLLLMLEPYLRLNTLGWLFRLWNIHYALLVPLALAGYALPRTFSHAPDTQKKLRRGLIRLMILADIVFVGAFLVSRTLFYTSEGYKEAMTIEISVPHDADEVVRKKRWRWGMHNVTFTSVPEANREIFKFYDSPFVQRGYVLLGRPTFESERQPLMFNSDGRIENIESMLDATWVDWQKESVIRLMAHTTQDLNSENEPTGASETMNVVVLVYPFFPWDEKQLREREGREALPSPPDSDPEPTP